MKFKNLIPILILLCSCRTVHKVSSSSYSKTDTTITIKIDTSHVSKSEDDYSKLFASGLHIKINYDTATYGQIYKAEDSDSMAPYALDSTTVHWDSIWFKRHEKPYKNQVGQFAAALGLNGKISSIEFFADSLRYDHGSKMIFDSGGAVKSTQSHTETVNANAKSSEDKTPMNLKLWLGIGILILIVIIIIISIIKKQLHG